MASFCVLHFPHWRWDFYSAIITRITIFREIENCCARFHVGIIEPKARFARLAISLIVDAHQVKGDFTMSDGYDEGRVEEEGPLGSRFSEKPNEYGGHHRTLYEPGRQDHRDNRISWDTDES